MNSFIFFSCFISYTWLSLSVAGFKRIPFVINTWNFTSATTRAWDVVYHNGKSALDAVEAGCTKCEIDQCDTTVGYGGSPDEDGETTLDAMIFDGTNHKVGSVAGLRRVKSAISVARKVLEKTEHTILVGEQATKFAVQMGFREENLSTPYSIKQFETWRKDNCQPNFWKNVVPDSKSSCGPYRPASPKKVDTNCQEQKFDSYNHDTIGMIVIDKNGSIAAGTSSNGAKHKIPGRCGDAPIPGAGAYVDRDVGGAACTGDGDIMMRFLPSYNTVENMRRGMTPWKAAEDSILRIASKYPSFVGAIIATTTNGEFGAACHGIKEFPFSIASIKYENVTVKAISCVTT